MLMVGSAAVRATLGKVQAISRVIVVNDPCGIKANPLRRDSLGWILDMLSGFTKVSTAQKPGGVIPVRPGLLRED